MNHFVDGLHDFEKFKERNELEWIVNKKTGKGHWNKKFHEEVDNEWIKNDKGFFNEEKNEKGFWQTVHKKWKLGPHKFPTCFWCGILLEPIRKYSERSRVVKYCNEKNGLHRQLFHNAIFDAKKKFNLKDPLDEDWDGRNWAVTSKGIWEQYYDKTGKLNQRKKIDESGKPLERVRKKDLDIWINGEKHKLTQESRKKEIADPPF